MYLVQGVNKYGQLYTDKGIIGKQYSELQRHCLYEFDSLNKARTYAKSFVRRYPHVICHIVSKGTDELSETYMDDEYWTWQQNHDAKRLKSKQKFQRFNLIVSSIGLFLLSAFVTWFNSLLQDRLGLTLQLILVPACIALLWYFVAGNMILSIKSSQLDSKSEKKQKNTSNK